MIDLDEIKVPFADDVHKMVKLVITPQMPPRRGATLTKKDPVVDNYAWYDQFGIIYKLKNNVLFVNDSKHFDSLLEHLDKIKSDVEVVININNCDKFNELCRKLSSNPTNKKIIIAFDSFSFNRRQWLDFEMIPDNVKCCPNFNYALLEELEYVSKGTSFDWWGLWLDDEDFECVRKKLTPKAKDRFEKMHLIAKSFYDDFSAHYGVSATDKQKVDFVFRWVSKNIPYDYGATNEDGTLADGDRGIMAQDVISTFERKTGVCVGRSSLMKLLLNNRFMRVNCFLTNGMYGNLQHTWNQVLFDDRTRGYYDLSYGVYNCQNLNSKYHNLDDEDTERNYVEPNTTVKFSSMNPSISEDHTVSTLPPRRTETPVLPPRRTGPPALPPRRTEPPALPPRRFVLDEPVVSQESSSVEISEMLSDVYNTNLNHSEERNINK